MSTNHARDDWAAPRTDEALRRGLDTLAGAGATASGLDDALGSVRSRVRRRRAVKKAGLGATTLAVAGGLVVGGASLLPEPPPDPVPAVTPTPTPSGTPDPSTGPSEEPAADSWSSFDDGHQPTWMEATDLVCGMPVEDLPASWDGGTLTPNGEPSDGVLAEPGTEEDPAYAEVGVRLALAADAPDGVQVNGVTLLWSQDGRLVDLGTNTLESFLEPDDLALDLTASDGVGRSCAPDGTAEGRTAYPHDLPPGGYEVRAFTRVWSPETEPLGVLLSEPWDVTIDDDGTVRSQVPDTTAGAVDSDDTSGDASDGAPAADDTADTTGCSTSAADVVPPDLSGLPAPVRATAGELVDAATACDDTALTARAEADGTATNFGGRSSAEFWGLPGAEEHEPVYRLLAQLVTATDHAEDVTSDDTTFVWPRVATAAHSGDDGAWQEVIDAGVLDADLAADMRQNEGYLGWRLGIHEDGTWRFFIAGD